MTRAATVNDCENTRSATSDSVETPATDAQRLVRMHRTPVRAPTPPPSTRSRRSRGPTANTSTSTLPLARMASAPERNASVALPLAARSSTDGGI
ncbi:hypothetical protein OG21DRAFT_1506651 [Imleria badia]|nr:hypothetical protein OG21DRAFT_1506651 [Imleria badia]